MNKKDLNYFLDRYKKGIISQEEILNHIKSYAIEDIGFAKVDHNRALRKGFPEVVYCEGKTFAQVAEILKSILSKTDRLLATRASQECFEYVSKSVNDLVYFDNSQIITSKEVASNRKVKGPVIGVVSAGTSDIPVAEEAEVTVRAFGYNVKSFYDIGIAGLNRLFASLDEIRQCKLLIVVAGMEGALPSAIGGLVDTPIIAVPTSIGYGTNLQGLSALLGMLNSCAPGLTVVNIDNGFGAGYAASQIMRAIE